MGFTSIIQHIAQEEDSTPSTTKMSARVRKGRGIPPSCQLYAVVGGDRWSADPEAVERFLSTINQRGLAATKMGTAEIQLFPAGSLSSCGASRKRLRHNGGAAREGEALLPDLEREADDPSERDVEVMASLQRPIPAASPPTVFDGLFLRNALSHARLTTDFEALKDFSQRVAEKAEKFWLSFEGLTTTESQVSRAAQESACAAAVSFSRSPATAGVSVLQFIEVELALVCTKLTPQSQRVDQVVTSRAKTPSHRAQELGVWVHSRSTGYTEYASRLALLFKHLFDELNGELFDGSVVQCVLAEDASEHPYCLRPLYCCLLLEEAFSYGSELVRPVLLEISCQSPDDGLNARNARANQRLSAASAVKSGSVSRLRAEGSVSPTHFVLPTVATIVTTSFKTSLPTVPAEVATTVVLRHLLLTTAQACGGGTGSEVSLSDRAGKPPLLQVVEECCHYGRVLSYHVHEDPLVRPHKSLTSLRDSSPAIDSSTEAQSLAVNNEDVFWAGHKVVLSIFVEFVSAESAVEAARHFAQRFAFQAANSRILEGQASYVRLFRNSTYYQGIQQDWSLTSQLSECAAGDDDDTDSYFDELLTESLLAE